VGAIELGYAAIDNLRNLIKAIGGEGAVKQFDRFSELFKIMINGALIAAAVGARAGLLGLGKGAAAVASSAVTTGVTAGGVTVTTSGGAAAGGGLTGAGGAASTAGGIGAGAAAGVVAGAGLLASGLGEGIFQLGEKGYNIEEDWKKKADSKGWWNPMKYWWGISAGIMGVINRGWSLMGGILDIVGAPFRMIIELIRFPFLSKEDQEKQRTNLEKYDARIREQFRKALNIFDIFGLIGDDEGSWGSLYGDTATDKMGFTKDGKTKSEQAAAKKGTILLSTPDLVTTEDFLDGKKSGEKVHSILKISSKSNAAGLDTHPSYAQGSMMIIENTTTYIQPIEV
jgi:hypothetical protein